MEKNYLMSIRQYSLNTLGSTYSNLPETYAYKREMMYKFKNVPTEEVPIEDKMKKYKTTIETSLNSINTITLDYPFLIYNITSKTLSCRIPEIQKAISHTLEQIELINIETKIRTRLESNLVNCSYDKKDGIIIINIPNFNENDTCFSAFLNSEIDQTLFVMCNLLYTPS